MNVQICSARSQNPLDNPRPELDDELPFGFVYLSV